ncbi:hypothetical protein PSE_3024 [Pseudovibrio sp. FO-BEG1]|nr:hypothetical protein PSE_3024 [Pseudovibrio sp. FO-BEG1]
MCGYASPYQKRQTNNCNDDQAKVTKDFCPRGIICPPILQREAIRALGVDIAGILKSDKSKSANYGNRSQTHQPPSKFGEHRTQHNHHQSQLSKQHKVTASHSKAPTSESSIRGCWSSNDNWRAAA